MKGSIGSIWTVHLWLNALAVLYLSGKLKGLSNLSVTCHIFKVENYCLSQQQVYGFIRLEEQIWNGPRYMAMLFRILGRIIFPKCLWSFLAEDHPGRLDSFSQVINTSRVFSVGDFTVWGRSWHTGSHLIFFSRPCEETINSFRGPKIGHNSARVS